MPKDGFAKKQHLRDQIAYFAARIMAEDGVPDFATAKRKAARMAGVADTRNLPDNSAVEQALLEYQRLYHGFAHGSLLEQLRLQALELMRLLIKFNPHLTGAVLAGYAEKNSGIHLQLFTESVKDVEMFLIDHKWEYESREGRVYVGEYQKNVPSFTFQIGDSSVVLSVFSYDDMRHKLKLNQWGKPLERANVSQVEALMSGAV